MSSSSGTARPAYLLKDRVGDLYEPVALPSRGVLGPVGDGLSRHPDRKKRLLGRGRSLSRRIDGSVPARSSPTRP